MRAMRGLHAAGGPSGPVIRDPGQWFTPSGCKRVLVVVHTVVYGQRLQDVFALLRSDASDVPDVLPRRKRPAKAVDRLVRPSAMVPRAERGHAPGGPAGASPAYRPSAAFSAASWNS